MNNNKLDKMKQEYNNFQVPTEAKQRMEDAIGKAKKETVCHVILLWTKRAGVTVAAAMLSLAILTNMNPSIAHALEKVPVIGAFTKVVTFRTYEDKSNNFEAKIEVPKITVDPEEQKKLSESEHTLNKSIEQYTNALMKRYENDMKEYGDEVYESLDSSYQTMTNSERLFTLRIDTVIAVGSSDAFSKFYHMDKKTDRIITLKDLFVKDSNYVSFISDFIIKQMKEQMAEDENKHYFLDPDMDQEFLFQKIKEEQNFYINDGKLVIVFDKYEAAPGYMGQPEFTISPEILQDILLEDSILFQ